MKYGKIRIEDGYLVFTRHMMINSLPCKDIMWAYMRRESGDDIAQKQLISNYLVIVTRRRKRYKFDMTEREIKDCMLLLKALNPEMAIGFPKGGRLAMQSLPNTRDLGALMTEDGRHILPRRLLRSGALYHLSLADQELFTEGYRLSTVIDFRSGIERKRQPDTVMPGVEYFHIPILDEESTQNYSDQNLIDVLLNEHLDDDFMLKQYKSFIEDQYSVKQFARFMDVLLDCQEGAVLWHCDMGKDRTGVGTALLLSVLGVPREGIMEDFLRTNFYLETELEYMLHLMEAKTIVDAGKLENIRALYRVKPEYLEAVFEFIEKEYGSMERFIRRALYLTPKAVEDLRDKYLI